MTHHSSVNLQWLLSDDCRKKALIKYKLNQYELDLHRSYCSFDKTTFPLTEVTTLCEQIIQHYCDYLQMYGETFYPDHFSSFSNVSAKKIYIRIMNGKQKLTKSFLPSDQRKYIKDLIRQYCQFKYVLLNKESEDNFTSMIEPQVSVFDVLLKAKTPDIWLKHLVEICNIYSTEVYDLISVLFSHPLSGIQTWLYFFSDQEFVHFFNAVFYFKLNPDHLFDAKIPSEKLLSVRTRLDSLYQVIEHLQQQLIHYCLHHHIPPVNDLLFHGDELLQGIRFQVSPLCKESLQQIVKEYKVSHIGGYDQKNIDNKLYDMFRAYKFWFNPSRLIDAVMVLQQALMHQSIEAEFNEQQFQQKMTLLYKPLKTTECLDLYGYFANKDSSYLLRLLRAVIEQRQLRWLPELKETEKKAVFRVFQTLQSIMEALRVELAHRQIFTEAYPVDFSKPLKKPGRRKRNAVLRILTVYGSLGVKENKSLEQLFNAVENSEAV
ncbi:hypothetical protein E3983_12270 [Legionella israelensis]|uniref:Uncharacterized protein n=1 Tax=Legionella israelensis TaxID=454 RepID=A0AAX1EIT0_9GAMM|nr:hypothetical protein [Legionella israelensis]QBR85056.1 hypothetical protein E3983_12270 [Legionella israelensis]